jgi:S-adenosylmethionine decarboxylase
MLDLVNCKVLSTVESEHVDAYLLSESSMFVFPHKLILKTCGTTTLLCGLPKILEIAALSAGFPHVVANPLGSIPAAATPYRVFYSRKNFLFPDQQRGPHRSWRDEVRYLDNMFIKGSAYMVGKMNGEHWYLYLTGPNTTLTPPPTPEAEKLVDVESETKVLTVPVEASTNGASAAGTLSDVVQDETLEILMTDLEPENAKQFYLDHASAVAEEQYFKQQHSRAMPNGSNPGVVNGSGMKKLDLDQGDEEDHHDSFDVFSNTAPDTDQPSGREKDGSLPTELLTEGHALGTLISQTCGLSEVYPESRFPDARVDAYLFTPCGFSANAVIPAPEAGQGTHYFTVHVTPEPHCSYASFETNVPGRQSGRQTVEVVEQVVNIFKPGRFSVTLFEAKARAIIGDSTTGQEDVVVGHKLLEASAAKRSARMESIRGYRRVDRIVHDLDDYDLVFRYYERDDWKGGAPRLGEVAF